MLLDAPAAVPAPTPASARTPAATAAAAPASPLPPVAAPLAQAWASVQTAVQPLLDDLSDADLVLLLARHAGILDPAAAPGEGRPLLAPPASDATVERLVLDLARRSGAHHATPEDVAAFAQLDPRVAAPLVTLLAAVGQAWDLRDAAVAGMPEEDQRALARMVLEGPHAHESPEAQRLAAPLDRAKLVEAAILLLDTAEAIVIPQLQAAADAGAWPADPIADPLGILRIGGTGDDVETMNRLLQVDARGNDTYHNNAGGTTLLADLDPTTLDYPVALSFDFEGDDEYDIKADAYAIGAAFLGLGLAADYAGDDRYRCSRLCQGSGTLGVGVLHDYAGDDIHYGGSESLGFSSLLSLLRNDRGSEWYRVGAMSGGYAFGPSSLGLLWDREGADQYLSTLGLFQLRFGWGEAGGRGWLADEGATFDVYEAAHEGVVCDGCMWTQGTATFASATPRGQGNDGRGGLAYILAIQDAIVQV